jgi:putative tryptophan/tyrosine transport system substrate-binding protein
MRRREFIALISAAAAAQPLAVRAQSGRTYRIGFLGVTSEAEFRRQLEALKRGLRQLGYEEGKNLIIEYRWAASQYDRLPDLAAELVRLRIDLLVAHSTPGVRAAKQATSTIPVVMAIVGDPIAAGLVESLSRPGGNLTGLTFFFAEIAAKRVELIKEAIPTLTRVAVFVNPANQSTPIALTAMQHMAGSLGVELVAIEVGAREEIADAILTVAARRAGALVAIEDPMFISNGTQIAALAEQHGLPMIGFRPQADVGALMDYGVDVADMYFRSAALVDKVLKGTRPADLPIERAVKFDLIVNLKRAKTLGIELPTSLLLRANEVIE